MIRNRSRLPRGPAAAATLDCIEAGIEAAHPEQVVPEQVALDGSTVRIGDTTYDLGADEETVVLGAGKAAGGVAAALVDRLDGAVDGGAVVTDAPGGAGPVETLTGDHPIPGPDSVAATRDVMARADAADGATLVLAVFTGGGSALLAAPAPGVGREHLVTTTEALLESGAPIESVNTVRKHLSLVKGGRLARRAAPATVLTLLVSDVVGDDPGVIASGPTVPDDSTFEDAVGVLERHGVTVPDTVEEHLRAGARGERRETPDGTEISASPVHVLANGRTAIRAAREEAREHGYTPLVVSASVRGEAREAALVHAAVAEEVGTTGQPVDPPAALLSGGETTVTVTGDGEGGPNLEFALRAAIEAPPAAVAAVDTDGHDGSTDAAGALVTPDTVGDPVGARDALADNDAYPYLEARDALVTTGRTGTNVNDLRVVVV